MRSLEEVLANSPYQACPCCLTPCPDEKLRIGAAAEVIRGTYLKTYQIYYLALCSDCVQRHKHRRSSVEFIQYFDTSGCDLADRFLPVIKCAETHSRNSALVELGYDPKDSRTRLRPPALGKAFQYDPMNDQGVLDKFRKTEWKRVFPKVLGCDPNLMFPGMDSEFNLLGGLLRHRGQPHGHPSRADQ